MDKMNWSLKIKIFFELHKSLKTKLIVTLSLLAVFLIVLIAIPLFDFFKTEVLLKNDVEITNINIVSYNEEDNYINMELSVNNKQVSCAYSNDNNVNTKSLEFNSLVDGKCSLDISFNSGYVYFKDEVNVISKPISLDNIVVDFKVNDKYYLALNDEKKIINDMLVIGEPNIDVIVSNDSLKMVDGAVSSDSNTNAIITIKNGDLQTKNVEVVVTDSIVKMPKEFDTKKSYLPCHAFSEEQAQLLDEILESRVRDAGYGTRAAAVAVARFITLEFPYKISYFYENGRVSGQADWHYVDGEGRYYHKGLYLSDSKIDDIKASLSGPAIWGCKVTNWEDNEDDGYYPGVKMPNGLDCSGYVSWNLYNGGFDPGDIGAGETPNSFELTDLGEFRHLTYDLIYSDKIKPGDLFNFWGHIAFIAGIDDNNFYVAESLNTYRGLVLKKYPKNRINDTFPYVVLMDDYYKEDGNLTYMW